MSDHERAQLTNWFEEHMGPELGDAMMRILPPASRGDIATRRDLQLLDLKLDNKIDALAARLDDKIDRLDTRIDRLDARIDRIEIRLDTMTETMTEAIGGMATRADLIQLQRTMVTWIFAAQATVVAAIGVLLGFLR